MKTVVSVFVSVDGLNLFQAIVAETSEYTAALQNSAAPQGKPSERSCHAGAKVQLPAGGK